MIWARVPLGEIAEVAAGGGAPQAQEEFGEDGHPFVRAGSLKGLVSGGAAAALEHLTPANAAKHKLRLFPVDTVLFAKSGMSASIGLVHRLSWSAYVVNHLAAVICGDRLDSRFLHQYLRAFSPTHLIQDPAYPSIRLGDIAGLKIPLPPLPEQRRIAAILDQADALRTKRREALAELDQLTQSIFVEMFGDPVTNPKGWDVQALKNLSARIQIGPFGSQLHEEDYIDDGIPLVNPTHIKDGRLYPSRSLTISESKHQQLVQYHLSKGDLIMGRRGEMGRCAVVTEKEAGWLCGTGSLFVRPNNSCLLPIYLRQVLSSRSMRKHLENVAQGVTMANLNKEIVGALPIPTPPIHVQHAYVVQLAKVENIGNAQNLSLIEINSLFSSLQHRAFRGEL